MNSEFAKALISARANIPAIEKDSINPHFKNRYASLDAINSAIVPVLSSHGLAVLQPVQEKEGKVWIETTLIHESGDQISYSYPLQNIADPQKMGSQITYGRRYSLCALLNITADEDDDGNLSSAKKNEQSSRKTADNPNFKVISEIKDILGDVDTNAIKGFIEASGKSSSADLTAPDLDEVLCKMMAYWGRGSFNALPHARHSLNRLISENKGKTWVEIAHLWKTKVGEKSGELSAVS